MHIFLNPPRDGTTALLISCGLPTEDLTEAHFQHFFGCGTQHDLTGVVGVDILGPTGLLRSLAVAEQVRGTGCGKRLIREAERYAASKGVTELFLLTNTARFLFETLGYAEVSREDAPEPVRATREFSSICPENATLMCKRIAA